MVSMDILTATLARRLAELGVTDAPQELLDVELVRHDLPGGPVAVVKPRDWEGLRAAVGERGQLAPYWATPWPSGLALAEHLASREDLAGLRVLELGCGLGIAACALARRGARVLATDADPAAVAFAGHSIALNELEAEVAVASWPDLAQAFRHDPFDLVVAADVLYRQDNADALARALPHLVAPGGAAVVADPGRAGARALWPMLRRRWRRDPVPVPDRDGITLHHLRRRTKGQPEATAARSDGRRAAATTVPTAATPAASAAAVRQPASSTTTPASPAPSATPPTIAISTHV